jgi:antibiotic biosynthesis monooxygenase (ABM) superfamily enzyme
VQHVPPTAVEEFKKWQAGVTAAVAAFPGYEGTDLYPPSDHQSDEWVTVIHFQNDQSLQQWINSPARAEWVARLRSSVGDFELKTLTGGFSAWFTGVRGASKQAPPGWKMALTVLFGLYPTVMLLHIFADPHFSGLGFAASMLIGNALSVSILQWLVMPALTKILAPWLAANESRQKALSIGGLVVLVVLLAGLAVLFHPVTG